MLVLAAENMKDNNKFNTKEFIIQDIKDNKLKVIMNGLKKLLSVSVSFQVLTNHIIYTTLT